MSHYSGLYDIQTLAMLSCVFAGSKRRVATGTNVESPTYVDPRRVASSQAAAAHTVATSTDVTPTNVRSSSVAMHVSLISHTFAANLGFPPDVGSVGRSCGISPPTSFPGRVS